MMYDKKSIIIRYIKERLKKLEELDKKYSAEKIEKLADNLISTNKPLEELYALIDNKFSYQARKISHNNHLAKLKEYYLENIEKLKKGNNCYLLSYEQGGKVLEQAYVEEKKEISLNLSIASINNEKLGYKKPNNKYNDYELIMSDIAYLLNINYAKTYRMFDENMNPIGILNEAFASKNERFLNFEEVFKFIKEESPTFNLKNELINFHDKQIKKGLIKIPNKNKYKENLEYVINLFKALPDITEENIKELKKEYLNLKIFELFTNSLDNNLTNYGIVISKDKNLYKYRLAPTFNKYKTNMEELTDKETICNFYIVSKTDLLHTIITTYYNETKELFTLIVENKETLIPLIELLIKEHLEYEEYKNYFKVINSNMKMFEEELAFKKAVSPDTEEDKKVYLKNNNSYMYHISPYLQNYDYDAFDEEIENKGSVALVVAVAVVMIITLLIIGVAIYAISKVEM